MSEPIDGLYFNWLRAKVLNYDAPPWLYLELLKSLYETEFVWVLIGDRNRRDEGLELRDDFLRETELDKDAYWYSLPCSVLEVLIAFAKRACFETDTPVDQWFWLMVTNLRLDGYRSASRVDKAMIDRILQTWMFRMYDSTGEGGLFPLRQPTEDQTQLEIWYQFNRYIDEQGL